MLVPSIIDVGLFKVCSFADPVPHSPNSAVANSEGLRPLMHVIENMKTVHMGPLSSCGVDTPDDWVGLLGAVITYTDLEIILVPTLLYYSSIIFHGYSIIFKYIYYL